MALGAEPRAVRWLVLRRSLSLCAVALAIGVLLSMAVSRQLGALLHGAAPVDPLVLSGASLALVLAALAASYLPARRASRIDPLLVLKQE
jgi:ABC-type antimicrobial peptide transport system permease subunit